MLMYAVTSGSEIFAHFYIVIQVTCHELYLTIIFLVSSSNPMYLTLKYRLANFQVQVGRFGSKHILEA